MNYDFIAIPDADVPQAVEPIFQHVVTTYASEANKTVSVWRAVPDDLLDNRPHEKTNTIRTIMVHQLLSERRFFAQFVGTQEPPVEELLPAGDKPTVSAYIEKYIWLANQRLPQLANGTAAWWPTRRTRWRRRGGASKAKAPLRIPSDQRIELIVRSGFGAADDWIAEQAGAGDIVVTADIPLAARCLEKGALALSPKGRPFRDSDIGDALALRELTDALPQGGVVTGGPAPMTAKDRSCFLSKLDEALNAVRRAHPPRDSGQSARGGFLKLWRLHKPATAADSGPELPLSVLYCEVSGQEMTRCRSGPVRPLGCRVGRGGSFAAAGVGKVLGAEGHYCARLSAIASRCAVASAHTRFHCSGHPFRRCQFRRRRFRLL